MSSCCCPERIRHILSDSSTPNGQIRSSHLLVDLLLLAPGCSRHVSSVCSWHCHSMSQSIPQRRTPKRPASHEPLPDTARGKDVSWDATRLRHRWAGHDGACRRHVFTVGLPRVILSDGHRSSIVSPRLDRGALRLLACRDVGKRRISHATFEDGRSASLTSGSGRCCEL